MNTPSPDTPHAPRSLVLGGTAFSNYFNKVKLVLLEKGLPFAEELVNPGNVEPAVLAASPLGKIPFLRVRTGAAGAGPEVTLCESQVIVDWLEAAYPHPPLLPADTLAAAKVRELATFVDLHLELVARELYGQAFFGGSISDSAQARVRKLLVKNIAGFQRLARFAPYVAGEQFTLADCSAWVSLPLVGMATKAVFGEDLLSTAGVDWKGYSRVVGERPAAQRVTADRKAAVPPQR